MALICRESLAPRLTSLVCNLPEGSTSTQHTSETLPSNNLVCSDLLQEDLIAGGSPLPTFVLLELSFQSGDFLLRPGEGDEGMERGRGSEKEVGIKE